MHVLLVLLYGGTIWLSALAYTLIAGGPFWLVAACGPFIVSGSMMAIWAGDLALAWMARSIKLVVRAFART